MLTVSTCTHSITNIVFIYLLEVQSTGVKEAMTYAGLVYYEEKRVEDLVTLTAAKNLEALIQVRMYSYTYNNVDYYLIVH